MEPLPDFVDRETYETWKKHRKAKKWSPLCHKIALRSILDLKAKGYDVNECLEWSAFKNWDGIFPKPDYDIPGKPQLAAEASKAMLKQWEEDDRRSQSPESHEARKRAMEKIKGVIKRVA